MSDCPIVRGLKGTRVTVLMDGTTKIRPQLVADTIELIERLRAELAAAKRWRDNYKNAADHMAIDLNVVIGERAALRAALAEGSVLLDDALRNKDIIVDWYVKASAERDALRADLAAERERVSGWIKQAADMEAQRDNISAELAKLKESYSE